MMPKASITEWGRVKVRPSLYLTVCYDLSSICVLADGLRVVLKVDVIASLPSSGLLG